MRTFCYIRNAGNNENNGSIDSPWKTVAYGTSAADSNDILLVTLDVSDLVSFLGQEPEFFDESGIYITLQYVEGSWVNSNLVSIEP